MKTFRLYFFLFNAIAFPLLILISPMFISPYDHIVRGIALCFMSYVFYDIQIEQRIYCKICRGLK